MARAKSEKTAWALKWDDDLFNEDDGVMVFETRKEARQFRSAWARFFRGQDIKRKPPSVVKVKVVVSEIKPEVSGDD